MAILTKKQLFNNILDGKKYLIPLSDIEKVGHDFELYKHINNVDSTRYAMKLHAEPDEMGRGLWVSSIIDVKVVAD